MAEREGSPHFPGQAPIDAYGNGGFRFADMSHRGSLLFLPSGVWAWPVHAAGEVELAALARVVAERDSIGVLLLGTGAAQVFPPREVRRAFAEWGIALETMSTGAAARTYNILLAESRKVGAALIAVE